MVRFETTDPQDELFDVLTPAGELTGQVAPRGVVHREGLWHAAFHLWIVCRQGEESLVLLQRRSLTKDTMAGRIDVSVGGHFRHGEYNREYLRQGQTVEPILREVREELGFHVSSADLRWIGTRWSEHQEGEKWDREIQELFLWVLPAVPLALAPDAREVAQVMVVPLLSLAELLASTVSSIPARLLWDASQGSPEGLNTCITRDDLAPDRKSYWRAMVQRLAAATRGQQVSALVLRDGGPEGKS